MLDLTEKIYGIILEEYKESGCELFDEIFLTQFNYVGGYQTQMGTVCQLVNCHTLEQGA